MGEWIVICFTARGKPKYWLQCLEGQLQRGVTMAIKKKTNHPLIVAADD